MQTGKPLRIISNEIAEKVARQIDNFSGDDSNHFNEIKLILDKEGSDYNHFQVTLYKSKNIEF